MNKKEIRTEKLRLLVAADGGPAEFARKRSRPDADKPIDPTYVSQILNKHRSFGERAAENMISRAGLPAGYFDTPEQDQATTAPHVEDVPLPTNKPISSRLQAVIDQLIAQQDNIELIKLVEQVLRVAGATDTQANQGKRDKDHTGRDTPGVKEKIDPKPSQKHQGISKKQSNG